MSDHDDDCVWFWLWLLGPSRGGSGGSDAVSLIVMLALFFAGVCTLFAWWRP